MKHSVYLFAIISFVCWHNVLTEDNSNEDETAGESETESEHGKDKKSDNSVAATASTSCVFPILICLLVPDHCLLHQQRSGFLPFCPVTHPKPACISQESQESLLLTTTHLL